MSFEGVETTFRPRCCWRVTFFLVFTSLVLRAVVYTSTHQPGLLQACLAVHACADTRMPARTRRHTHACTHCPAQRRDGAARNGETSRLFGSQTPTLQLVRPEMLSCSAWKQQEKQHFPFPAEPRAGRAGAITESQNSRGWKGPLWVTQSNPPAEAGSPTAGCTGPCPGRS